MGLNIPEKLQTLEANCGIYAIWMLFQHYGVDLETDDLVKLCRHNAEDGVSTIAIAVALKQLGLNVSFHTDTDPDIQPVEQYFYDEAEKMHISMGVALSYDQIMEAVALGRFVIVFYDTLDGVGNHSLVYSVDEQEICFFDSMDAMPARVFEQQRKAEGICRQAMIIDDSQFVERMQVS